MLESPPAKCAGYQRQDSRNAGPNAGTQENFSLLLARALPKLIVGLDAGFDEGAVNIRKVISMACQPVAGNEKSPTAQKGACLFRSRRFLVGCARGLQFSLPGQKVAQLTEPVLKCGPFAQQFLMSHFGRDLAIAAFQRHKPPILLCKLLRDVPLLGAAFGPARPALDDIAKARYLG